MIQLENLTKVYRMGNVEMRALGGVDLTIGDGELVAITGPSGSGTSTLINILGCLDLPTSGRYLLDGTDVSSLSNNQLAKIRSRKIGFCPSRSPWSRTPTRSATSSFPWSTPGCGRGANRPG